MDRDLVITLSAVVVAGSLSFIGVLLGMLWRSQEKWIASVQDFTEKLENKLDALPTKEKVQDAVEIRVLQHEGAMHIHSESGHA